MVRLDAHSGIDLLVNEIAELRPFPTVAARVLEIAESDHFSAHELAQAISTDQALTAKMLRLANSAYYGFPRRITTVRDAVVLLGFRSVRSATLASCVIDALPGSNHIDYSQFWRFSVTVGMLGEVLARATRRYQDEAFTAGVVHNIGRLALDQQRPSEFLRARNLAAREQRPLHEVERELFGFTDADLGGALALHWSFPADLAEAVARHQFDVTDLPDRDSLAGIVLRARMFGRASGLTDGVEDPQRTTTPYEWSVPPVSTVLNRSGGIEGVIERVGVFVDNALRG